MVELAPVDLDFSRVPRTFKRSGPFKPTEKKYKNMKALLVDEQKRLQALAPDDSKATYFTVEAPPSLKPAKKWCDITGLPGKYKTVRHGLRYYNKEVFAIINELSQGVDQQYLELRNANVVLR
ncbi:chromatin-remodeling complex subunit Ies6p [Trichomonascus vanleenenianus]|uniref:Ies6p n=1 Tax=Trichomonascus vanleenenianus TaxID=2268995 RepID=UPI003EC9C745